MRIARIRRDLRDGIEDLRIGTRNVDETLRDAERIAEFEVAHDVTVERETVVRGRGGRRST